MVTTHVYVEGGGNNKAVQKACTRGFSKFIEGAGLTVSKPKIVACGGRGDAYQSFRRALNAGNTGAMLLVDSENPLMASNPWQHLNASDGWNHPNGATVSQCHLMVQVMESWFLADRGALQSFYGTAFRPQDLPPNPAIENIPKQDVLDGLARATRDTKNYKKGTDSFKILESLDPAKVRAVSPHADRFIRAL
jgi:hypothetical protein